MHVTTFLSFSWYPSLRRKFQLNQDVEFQSIEQNQLTEITEAVFTRMFSGLNPCLTYLVTTEYFTVLSTIISAFFLCLGNDFPPVSHF